MSFETIYEAVVNGDADVAKAETQAAVSAGISAADVLHKACIPAMTEVGRQFEIGEKYVPEMLIAARAMQGALGILKPLLVEEGAQTIGRVAIGTVKGDLHDIGKNLVGMMLEGAGFDIVDLGVDVSPDAFVDAARKGAQIIGMSALLTTTMGNMGVVVNALKAAGVRDQVKVLIGGAPVTQEFANSIGADAFAPDASSAARVARQLRA